MDARHLLFSIAIAFLSLRLKRVFWRQIACAQRSTLLRIISSTIESQKPEEELDFHAKQILARLMVQVISDKFIQICCNKLTNWKLGKFKFNSTLGYPGEGPNCKKCGQPHDRTSRAAKCKCLKQCKLCKSHFDDLNQHMNIHHGGWQCKKCSTKHTSKRNRDECKCSWCAICKQYLHNLCEHEKFERQRKATQKYHKGRRANQTTEEKANENAKANKRVKSRRASEKSSKKEHRCEKCHEMFRYAGHAKRCACEECIHCGETTRPRYFPDLPKHTKHKHPDKYVKPVKKREDPYKKMKTQCVEGSKEMLIMYKDLLTDEDFQKQWEKHEGTTSKTKSVDVQVTAKILDKNVDEIEGVETWSGELWKNGGQQCREVDVKTGTFTDEIMKDTEQNIPLHQAKMMQTRDEEYRRFQMRTCNVCCERRWWQRRTNEQPIPQRYIKPLNENNMYPNDEQKQHLQEEFEKLNTDNNRPKYQLCDRALEAAHRVCFTSTHDSEFVCSLCANNNVYKTEKYKRWELFTRFNMSTPSPAPKVLQRLNPVERQIIARSAVVMTIHNRLHDTNRKQSRSTGHGCIIDMDAAL